MLKPAPKNIHLYLESNPNPNSMKFVVNEILVPEGMNFDFPSIETTGTSPLAKELFGYPFVDRVFYASNFVTVTKKENVEWLEVQNTIKNHIKEFLESGKFIIDIPKAETVSNKYSTNLSRLVSGVASWPPKNKRMAVIKQIQKTAARIM